MRILALEPYYGGSHKAFLDGWRRHSRHEIEVLGLPDRRWKWRMRGGAMALGERARGRAGDFDLLFASDFLDLAALVSARRFGLGGLPRVVYFHENQLTYPVPDYAERQSEFGFTNLTTCLAADRILFNTRYHRESFLRAAGELIANMADHVPGWVPDEISGRSAVVPVGVDFRSIDAQREAASPREGPLRVLWNHRWEYDKGVDVFFDLMGRFREAGHEFDLVATGGDFTQAPPLFRRVREEFADRLRHLGYVEGRSDYCRLLCECDVVVSTARHEFFGISVVEAVYAGCAPLLPDRMSYPELLADRWHEVCLYADGQELERRMTRWMDRPEEARRIDASACVRRFGWDRVAPRLERAVERAVEEAG